MNAGAHDGTTSLEAAFEQHTMSGRRPGFVVVKSAGNERGRAGHARLQMVSQSQATMSWNSTSKVRPIDDIELWFCASDEFKFTLGTGPGGQLPAWWLTKPVTWGYPIDNGVTPYGNRYQVSYTRYHHDNGDSRLLIAISVGDAMDIESCDWHLRVESGVVKSQGFIHAWVERDESRPVSFTTYIHDSITISIPGTARSIITVASIAPVMPIELSLESSFGPTRDERHKPDLSAPGSRIIAADAGTEIGTREESGSSMAAPHVTGAIALLLSNWEKHRGGREQLNAVQVRAAMVQSTSTYNGHWHEGMGYGVLDVESLLARFRGEDVS